jgi:hypothetical protein
MREKGESLLGQVADAVNAAPPGQVISGSEEEVRDEWHLNLRKPVTSHAFCTHASAVA